MAEFSSYPPSHLCWIDLMSRDAMESAAFYGAVFGWEMVEKDMEGAGFYALFRLGGKVVAGLGEMTANMRFDGMPAIWNTYINAFDVDEVVKRVPALGGRVFMEPGTVMTEGTIAGIEDPSSAHFFLWQPDAHIGCELTNLPGTWVWSELATSDAKKATEFYGQLFGWGFEQEAFSNGYWMIRNGDRQMGGIVSQDPQDEKASQGWSVYFSVADLNKSVSAIENAGGKSLSDSMPTSVGTIIDVEDNHGAGFKLIEMSVAPDDSP